LISGNFPETAWRTTDSRQAAHVNIGCFWVGTRERLAVKPYTGRWRKLITISGFFFYELPGGDEYPPGDASGFGSVLVFCVF